MINGSVALMNDVIVAPGLIKIRHVLDYEIDVLAGNQTGLCVVITSLTVHDQYQSKWYVLGANVLTWCAYGELVRLKKGDVA